MKGHLILAPLVATAAAVPFTAKQIPLLQNFAVENELINNPKQVANKEFDYIIAGGGLTGLTIAARLTANPDISVLVIESGYWESETSDDITNLTHYGRVFHTEIDYAFITQLQDIDGKSQTIHSGRGLGGSTLVNGGSWTRPHRAQIDSWSSVFGNTGWTWDEVLPYMLMIEKHRDLSATEVEAGMYYNASCHGTKGYIHAGARNTGEKFSPIMKALMETAKDRKIPVQKDLACGEPHGVSMISNIVTEQQYRADAGRELLEPNVQRPNLYVLVGQNVGKVLMNTTGGGTPRATGVQYGRHHTTTFEAYAKHEVLLAAGSSRSPLILEYSGIGDSAILAKAGVKQIVDLPVGFNQQDQTTTAIRNNATKAGAGQGQAAYFASFNETFGQDAERAYKMLTNKTLHQQWADQVIKAGAFPAKFKDTLIKQYENYVDHIVNKNVAYSELFMDTYGAINFDVWNLLPFSRGYIHIGSADPYLRHTLNNPNYFGNDLDILGQAATTRLARNLSQSGHVKQYWAEETIPGSDVPSDATLDGWANYVRTNYRANYHAVATCAMMKKEMGGVVDNTAKVYDTLGLRVVDGSIPPTQVSSHVMTVFYGMAEKIAKSILDDYKKSNKDDVVMEL